MANANSSCRQNTVLRYRHVQHEDTRSHASTQTANDITRALRISSSISPARRIVSYRSRATTSDWDNFTHRLCDKKRESANLLIRLFFRPSSIADAAISIFVLPPPRKKRDIQEGAGIDACYPRALREFDRLNRPFAQGYISRRKRPLLSCRFISRQRRTLRAHC